MLLPNATEVFWPGISIIAPSKRLSTQFVDFAMLRNRFTAFDRQELPVGYCECCFYLKNCRFKRCHPGTYDALACLLRVELHTIAMLQLVD